MRCPKRAKRAASVNARARSSRGRTGSAVACPCCNWIAHALGQELNATLAALRADPDIELVEPDRRVHAHAYRAYRIRCSLASGTCKSAQPAAIRADSAWDVTHGGASPATSTVVVAVLDTGVRFEHPDLRRVSDANGKLLPGYDFVSGELRPTSLARPTTAMAGIRILPTRAIS